MKIYKGDLIIDKDNCSDFTDLEKVTSNLYIYPQAKLSAPNLKSIGGYLYIYPEAKLSDPNLKSVGGLLIYPQADLSAPNLKSIGGSIFINSQADLNAPNLKSVVGDLSIYSQAKLPNLKSVSGDLYIGSQVKLPNLKSIGGYLSINSQADLNAPKLKSVGGSIFINSQTKLTPNLLKIKYKSYYIESVEFNRSLFLKVYKDQLTAKEVFGLTNIEQRRVAYTLMDKAKMKDLPNLKTLDEVKDDGYGYPMKVIEFTHKDFDKPFRFLNCFCPSSSREYFLETQATTCKKAKAKSFGFESLKIDQEW